MDRLRTRLLRWHFPATALAVAVLLSAPRIAAGQQAPNQLGILIDGHVATDTLVNRALADSAAAFLAKALAGTRFTSITNRLVDRALIGGGLPPAPWSLADVLELARITGSAIVVETNAGRLPGGGVRLEPFLALRELGPFNLGSIDAPDLGTAAWQLAARVAADTTALLRRALDDAAAQRAKFSKNVQVEPTQTYFEFQVERQAVLDPASPRPPYPNLLRSTGVAGEVFAQFVVDAAGSVDTTTIKIIKSTHELMSIAVKKALPTMRFTPASIGSKPVRQLVQLMFPFDPSKP